MEEVHRKACSCVIYGARSVTKASETVAAAEVVCHALNEMSFFGSSSEAASASARARVSVSTHSDVLNLQVFRQSNSLV